MFTQTLEEPIFADNELLETERRAAVRRDCRCRCLVRPVGSSPISAWHAMTIDLSTTGLSMLLQWPLRRGTRLVIQAWDGKNVPDVEATIVRSQAMDCVWLHACEFVKPLREAQLHRWRSAGVMRVLPECA